ncbi:uncharacterized protein LOC121867292 isoform X2 [Homarus americanus]|uniref:uncharacterized protein LOC121867292 isoform X2 n=1 Tax=Homarus americanus TaxID=6706 RepID=UPI001C479603|nr:uncharacterized protein LOC121867292 isoform X2 [Homarus americanus]
MSTIQHKTNMLIKSASTRNMKCDVCDTSYLTEGHRPRALPCGHSVCTSCIKNLIKGKMVTCPQCRYKVQGVQTAEEIPANFALIHMLEENARASRERGQPSGSHSSSVTGAINRTSSHPKQKECSPHSSKCLEAGADIASHCAFCQVWLCMECCRIDHRGIECLITPFKETLSEMKQAKKNKAEVARKNLKESWGEIKNYSDKLESCSATVQITLDCIKMEQKRLEKVLSDGHLAEALLQSVTEDLSEMKTVNDALKVFHDIDGSISNTRQWVSSSDSAHLSDRANKLSKEQLHTIVLLHSTSFGSASTSGVLAVCTRKENQVYSELGCDGDRILLHSLKQFTPPSGTRAIPLQAAMLCIDSASALTFLDLSWGGSHFGRVFIRLMGDTVRGQQFLKLCTGEMGPTFRNSHFHRVWWKGLPGEHVWGGDYDQGDGSGGTSLKIEAKYHDKSRENRRLPISAGLVAGSYEREKASSLFRIYTKDDASVIEEAAFGRVEYGLHFIDSVINHNNIRDVKICDCGVVIE